MDLLAIGLLLLFIAWQLIALRSDVRFQQQITTVFYSIQSLEKDVHGTGEESIHLRKKIPLPLAISPGMEFAGIANNQLTLVERVVFDAEGRALHLKPGLAPLAELEEIKKWYQSRGWQSDI